MTFATTAGIDTTGNNSDANDGFVLKVTFFCIIIPLSLTGNSLVCIAFSTDKILKRVPGNFLLVSLATADILLTLVVMICTFVEVIKNKWIFGAEFCTFYICTDIMCCTASILNLCAISIDRYLRIKYALHYDLMMTPLTIGLTVFMIWAISGLLSFGLVNLGWHKLPNNLPLPDGFCIFQANFTYALISSCISFYIPSIIILVIYYKIFRIAGLHVNHIESHNISNKQKRKKAIFENKAAFTLGITTGVFIVCWLPFFICNVLARWSPNMVSRHFFVFSLYAGYSNSCFNPIIYSIFNTEYRRSFARILCGKKQNSGSLSSSFRSSRKPSLTKQHQMISPENSCPPPDPALELDETMDNKAITMMRGKSPRSDVEMTKNCSGHLGFLSGISQSILTKLGTHI